MIKIFLMLTIISQATFSMSKCKETIMYYYKVIGSPLDAQEFSSVSFVELELTTEEFNALDAADQVLYFEKLKPIKMKAQETLQEINMQIFYINEHILRITLEGHSGYFSNPDIPFLEKRKEMLEDFGRPIGICANSNYIEATEPTILETSGLEASSYTFYFL